MILKDLVQGMQNKLAEDFTEVSLKVLIICLQLFVIFLALTVKNKWILAGILAWEITP